MKVNNKDFSTWNMRCLAFDYQPLGYAREIYQPDQSITPIMSSRRQYQPKPMTFDADFKTVDDAGRFLAELMSGDYSIIDMDDGYLYRCYLSEIDEISEKQGNGYCYTLSIPLSVIQTGTEVSETLEADVPITVIGHLEAECIYEITPKQQIEEYHIAGYTINNLQQGVTVYFDGIDKRIYSSAELNKFGDVTFPNNRFPTLRPGEQVIDFDATADVVLRYYPIYI